MDQNLSGLSVNEVFDKAEEALMSLSSLCADGMRNLAIQLNRIVIDPESSESDTNKAASFIDQLDPKIYHKKSMEQIEGLMLTSQKFSVFNEDDFVAIEKCRTESFFCVYSGKTKDGHRVLMKVAGEPEQVLKDEVRVIQNINHPYICRYYGYSVHPCLIIQQFCPTDLREFIRGSPTVIDCFRIAYQTGCAVEYLHSLGLLHHDLKPANILIDEDGNVKLGGFYFAQYISCEDYDRLRGTLAYMAPELFQRKKVTLKIDVFAFGMILFQLFTFRTPSFSTRVGWSREDRQKLFPFLSFREDDYSITEGDGKPPKTLFDLMSKCCSFDPESRPEMSTVVRMIRDFGVFHVMHGNDLEERFWKIVCCFSFKDRVSFLEFIECMTDLEPHGSIEETLQMALSSSSPMMSITEYWLLCCCFPHFFCDKLAFSIMEKVVHSDWYCPSEEDSYNRLQASTLNSFVICPCLSTLSTSPFIICTKSEGAVLKYPIVQHSLESGVAFSSDFTGDISFDNIAALAEWIQDPTNEKHLSPASKTK